MTRDELCWLAGWLEGEGTFYASETKGNSPRAVIQVFSVDRDTIEKAARLMGGRITVIKPRECRGTQWKSQGGLRAEVGGEPAAALMRQLLPFMGQRRTAQITKALSFWESRSSRPVSKLCACGCGQEIFGGRRLLYANRKTGSCAMRAFRARQKEIAA